MNNTITPVSFQRKIKASNQKTEAQKSAAGAIKEEEVKNIIQKTINSRIWHGLILILKAT